MSIPDRWAAPILASLLLASAAAEGQERYGLGKKISERDLAAWDIDVRPDGAGLPRGRGRAREGREIFLAKCSACHGERGEGSAVDRLGGRTGSPPAGEPL